MKFQTVNFKKLTRMLVFCLAAVALTNDYSKSVNAQEPSTFQFGNMFNDRMVLQCRRPIRIWGHAKPNSAVSVELATLSTRPMFEKAKPKPIAHKSATADVNGRWQVTLKPRAGSYNPHIITATAGDESIVLEDVLFGEVWIASGQSNMAWGLGGDTEWEIERVAADYPAIRYCGVKQRADEPLNDFHKRLNWKPLVASEDLGSVSGVSYYFAVYLHRYLRVPVGIYCNAIGGTLAEQWTSKEKLESIPELASYMKSDAPRSDCYNGGIAPAANYSFRGAIFFQGENNSIGKWHSYKHSFPAMIENWRETLKSPNLPFGIISLYGFGPYGTEMDPELSQLPPGLFWYAAIRDVHFRTHKSIENTGLITTWDVGDTANIHPHRKMQVGYRTARWALAKVYNKPIVHTAPEYREAKVEGDQVKVYFDLDPMTQFQIERDRKKNPDRKPAAWVGWPFTREGKAYRGFTIAGEDRRFYPATVKRGKEVGCLEATSPLVPKPVAVRFGWSGMPDSNVIGMDHLPVHPFRTDDWELPEDTPYSRDDPARKTWSEKMNAAKEKAKSYTLQRKIREMQEELKEFRNLSSRSLDDDKKKAAVEKIAEIHEELQALLETVSEG